MEAERFVVIAAAEVDALVTDVDEVLERQAHVILLLTTPDRSRTLSKTPGAVVSVYASESMARRAFASFEP